MRGVPLHGVAARVGRLLVVGFVGWVGWSMFVGVVAVEDGSLGARAPT